MSKTIISMIFVSLIGGCSSNTAIDPCPAGNCDPTDFAVPADLATPPPPPPDLYGLCIPGCAMPTPFCNSHQVCVACLTDDNCPSGQICKVSGKANYCVAGCTNDARCGAGTSCCGGGCIDTSKDPSNCGACGVVCAIPNAVNTCVAGKCQMGACNTAWGDCNNNPMDGCETSLHSDIKNCGGCGRSCSFKNGVAGCAFPTTMGNDACYLAACQYGWDDCNNDPSDGCEAPVTSDPKNCGACGNACPVAANGGLEACQNATCVIKSCNQGFFDCNGLVKDGCETNIGTDAKNCGACGVACQGNLICRNQACTCANCTFPNAKSLCINNVCSMGACLAGYSDCDGKAANGCEVSTDTDVANCGGCGKPCPMNMPGCLGGMCNMGCLNGKTPPNACDNGMDPETNKTYTICTADCTSAWISATNGGGMYHSLQICQNYGYTTVGRSGGTCGATCSYCKANAFSCMMPQMGTTWDGGGKCGNDQFGPIICNTVQWECLK